MSHNAGLAAVVDIAAADNMGADVLLCPALPLGLTDGVPLRLRPVLAILGGPLVLVVGLEVLAQRDAAAPGVGDLAVLYDPAP